MDSGISSGPSLGDRVTPSKGCGKRAPALLDLSEKSPTYVITMLRCTSMLPWLEQAICCTAEALNQNTNGNGMSSRSSEAAFLRLRRVSQINLSCKQNQKA